MGLSAFVAGLGALVASELNSSPPQPINCCPYEKNSVALVEDSPSSSASSKSKTTASHNRNRRRRLNRKHIARQH